MHKSRELDDIYSMFINKFTLMVSIPSFQSIKSPYILIYSTYRLHMYSYKANYTKEKTKDWRALQIKKIIQEFVP